MPHVVEPVVLATVAARQRGHFLGMAVSISSSLISLVQKNQSTHSTGLGAVHAVLGGSAGSCGRDDDLLAGSPVCRHGHPERPHPAGVAVVRVMGVADR